MGPPKTEQVCTGPSSLPVTVGTRGYMTAAGCTTETRRAGGRECEAVDNVQSPLRVYSQIPLSAALQEHPVQTDPLLAVPLKLAQQLLCDFTLSCSPRR